MHPLHRLVYFSIPRQGISMPDILNILNTARTRNAECNITGFLTFHERCFLQTLEGSREALSHLYSGICRDPRHHSILLMGYETTTARKFSDWNMGYLPLANGKDPRIGRYCVSGNELRPNDLSVDGAVSLLCEMSQDAAATGA
nr:BLUF domain-containing protein [uncultured Rhodoferax sp.]